MCKTVCLIFIVSFYFSCKENGYVLNSLDGPKVKDTIEIDNLISRISSAEAFGEMKLIPLELNQNSAVDKMSRIIKLDSSFIILDRGNFCIFEFDEGGRYKRKIISVGRGPMEYLRIIDIKVNRFTGYLDILDPRGKILSYDLDRGEFVKEIVIDQEGVNLFGIHEFEFINPSLIVFYSIFSENKLYLYDLESKKITQSYFHVENELPAYLTSMRTLTQVNDQILYLNIYDYTLYSIHDMGPIPVLHFSLGDYDYRNNRELDGIKRGSRESGQTSTLREIMMNSNTLYPVFNYFPHSHFFQFLHKMNTVTMYTGGKGAIRVDSLFNDKSIKNTLYFDDKSGIYGWITDPVDYEAYIPQKFRTEKNMRILSQWEPNDNPIIVKYVYAEEELDAF